MTLAVDGDGVEIELETPLANVLSFEHAPETDEQRNEVGTMAARMLKGEVLFVLPKDAQCSLKDLSMKSGVIDDALLFPDNGDNEKNGVAHGGNAEKSVNDSDGGSSGTGVHRGLGDLDVNIFFVCSKPDKLTSIRVDLFDAFPDLRELEVQMLTPKGQGAAELTANARIIRW